MTKSLLSGCRLTGKLLEARQNIDGLDETWGEEISLADSRFPEDIPLAASFARFGAIHIASWNIDLPSEIEMWAWRAGSLYYLIYSFIGNIPNSAHGSRLNQLYPHLDGLMIGLYVIVKLYMIVEIFISLRVLARRTYDWVEWSRFVPHI